MVTASATLHDHELKDIPVLNPGGWFGKAWLIEIGGSYWPLFLIVEADSVSDAIDVGGGAKVQRPAGRTAAEES